MDSVVHFEIPADDPKRASSFYKKAFGWTAEEFMGMGYWMLGTTETNDKGPVNPGAINGGMGKRAAPLKNIVVTISVQDIDKSLDKIEKLGGKTVQKKQEIGGNMGFTAYFKDSEGNIVGLWQGSA